MTLELPSWATPERPVPGREGFTSIPGEAELADRLGGQRRVMSGAGQHPYDLSTPQDLVRPSWLIDKKETSAKSVSISRAQLARLTQRALREGRLPMHVITFFTDGLAGDDWALVRLSDLPGGS